MNNKNPIGIMKIKDFVIDLQKIYYLQSIKKMI